MSIEAMKREIPSTPYKEFQIKTENRQSSTASVFIQILNTWLETDAYNLHNHHYIGAWIKFKHQNNHTRDNKTKKNT